MCLNHKILSPFSDFSGSQYLNIVWTEAGCMIIIIIVILQNLNLFSGFELKILANLYDFEDKILVNP